MVSRLLTTTKTNNGIGLIVAIESSNTATTTSTLFTKFIDSPRGSSRSVPLSVSPTSSEEAPTEEIDLSGKAITSDDFQNLLADLPTKRLYLRNCNLRENEAKQLAEALKGNTTINVLGLEGNAIGDAGAKAIASLLAPGSALTELELSGNGLSSDGVLSIAHALKHNTTLRELYLEKTTLDEKTLNTIAQTIENNKTLEVVALDMPSEKIDEITNRNHNARVAGAATTKRVAAKRSK